MTQATLFSLPLREQPKAPIPDPYTAETYEEFQRRFKLKRGRNPRGMEILDYFDMHPEAWDARHDEPYKVGRARREKARKEADKHWLKLKQKEEASA